MIEIVRALLFLSLGIFLLVFGLYGSILLYYGKLKRNEQGESEDDENVKFEPFVSVIVPTHNEEIIVSKKIENLLASNYPREKLEIIFVDDSDDSTPNIIQEYSKRFPNIRLIRFRRRVGYSPSMIAGCKAAQGETLVLSDAGSFFDAKPISFLVRHFQTPDIGVVAGDGIIINSDEQIGKSESLYQSIFNFKRIAESSMDSTFFVRGEATAVRKDLITDLETCTATFDTAVGLFVRQKGYKVIYDPQVKFYEYAPSTHSERVQQKVTRAANLIRILLQFRSMIFRRRYGKYGCIILPFNFAMLVFAPAGILIGVILLGLLTPFDLSFALTMWSIIGFLFLLFLAFARSLVVTFFEFEYSLLKALYQIIFTRTTHDKIEKVASTRR